MCVCVSCMQRDKCVFFLLPVGWIDSSLAKYACVYVQVYVFTVSECVPYVGAAWSPYALPVLTADVCQSHSKIMLPDIFFGIYYLFIEFAKCYVC